MSSVFLTYQDLEQSPVPIPVFAKICKVANIYDWKLRGIPARYQKLLSSVITKAKRAAENKAARLAARAPQIDLFSSVDSVENQLKKSREISNKINNLTDNLRGFSPSLLANNRKSAVALEPHGFQPFKKIPSLPKEHIVLTAIREVIADNIERNEEKYYHNLDALAYASNPEPEKNPYLEYYYLSSIVRRIEGQVKIDTFKQIRKQGGVVPPKEHSLAAYNCGRRVMPDKLKQQIYGENAPKGAVDVISCDGKMSYHGLMVCKDVWGCPTCARKITERRKNGLSLLLNSHVDMWGESSISATLFTIPHGLGNDLDDILDRMHKAWRFMTMSTSYKNLMKSQGLRGSVRALEVTYGKNGFHPHFHVLHFFDHNIKKGTDFSPGGDVEFIRKSLFNMWTKALNRHEFKSPDIRAFGCVAIATDKKSLDDVADYFGKMEKDVTDSDINVYLRKHKSEGVRTVNAKGKLFTHTWGEESEMTKWHIKRGGNYRYSMFDFLRGFSISELQGDKENQAIFKDLWLTYRRGFKAKQQLVTRHKDFKIAELEATDEAVSDLESTEQKTVALSVTFEQWVTVLRCNARASLLHTLQAGQDVDQFFSILSGLSSKDIKKKSKVHPLAARITAVISRGLITKKEITDFLGISFKTLDSWYYKVPPVYIPIIEAFLSKFV